ncbi:hypothetical protein L0B52_02590 [Suttonella sp. R2A3]|uniref:polyhydroxyalkanoate synthesis regulator DNA-binding domain-containing protein n=1 Tax=Suttonella sp. R2A3 TaxID=2908648 RepID=UPI001F2D00BE|nr:polyhydroxyalkanoate synthesis regulator DNA-binding domain-containing protein [Suttonella sp. R2A3]UJF25049.1 hypothetical protein L0B52_02590 [Suttonella sp. R2A3]
MSAREIKKYANRRLYDSQDSQYISSSDIRAMLEDGETLSIIDSRSGNDITRAVLLNLLAESDQEGTKTILSQQMLGDLLRYDDPLLAGMVGVYLEQCFALLIEHQDQLHRLMHDFDAPSPHALIEQLIDAQRQVINKFSQH